MFFTRFRALTFFQLRSTAPLLKCNKFDILEIFLLLRQRPKLPIITVGHKSNTNFRSFHEPHQICHFRSGCALSGMAGPPADAFRQAALRLFGMHAPLRPLVHTDHALRVAGRRRQLEHPTPRQRCLRLRHTKGLLLQQCRAIAALRRPHRTGVRPHRRGQRESLAFPCDALLQHGRRRNLERSHHDTGGGHRSGQVAGTLEWPLASGLSPL